MVLFPDSPAPKNQILHSLDINLYTEAKQWNTTQTRIDLYWHKERLYNVTKARVIKKNRYDTAFLLLHYLSE